MRRIAFALALAATMGLFAATVHATGFMVGNGGDVLKTTDLGINWTVSDVGSGELFGVDFLDANNGIAVGVLGRIRRTVNGGTTWTDESVPGVTNQLNDVSYGNSTTVFAVGLGVLLKSVDAGNTWTQLAYPAAAEELLGVKFTSALNGIAIGGFGGIYRTTDGGANWTHPVSGTSARLEDVDFPSATTGFIVGFDRKVLKTTDGGATWSLTTLPVTTDLHGVKFVSGTTGWACGTNGALFFTTNGGTTWTQRGNPAGNRELRCIGFANDQEIYVGGAGVNLRSLDGGLSWVEVFAFAENYNEIALLPSTPISGTINVTINTVPANQHYRVAGADYSTPQTFRWRTFNSSGDAYTCEGDATIAVNGTQQLVFGSWSDGGARAHAPHLNATTTLTLNYTTQYMLTVTHNAGGTTSPANGFRDAGSIVNISATPNAGFNFGGWTGAGAGSFTGANASASVTMNAPITETATFTAGTFNVTVRTSPTGRSFSVDGTTFTTTQTFAWTTGSTHTLTTTATQSTGAGSQAVWTSWSDGGARTHTVTASPSVTSYTANFQAQYFLTMVENSTRHTAVPASGWFDAGASVNIDCPVDPFTVGNFYFSGWTGTGSGAYTGPLQQRTIVMNGPITETASFTSFPNTLVWFGTSPDNRPYTVAGVARSGWTPLRFIAGSSIVVGTDSLQNVNASQRYRLLNWSDGGLDTHAVAISLTGPDTLLATFRSQFFLTMAADTGGFVSPASGFHDAGSAFTIQAFTLPNFTFTGWTGTGSGSYTGTVNPRVITMNGPITEAAHWVGGPITLNFNVSPAGAKFKLNGTTITGSQSIGYVAGVPATLEAISPQNPSPTERWLFSSWSDGSAATHTTAFLANTNVGLLYRQQFLLTTAVDAGGGGSVSASPFVTKGDTVTIVATPAPGHTFAHWVGAGAGSLSGTTNPLTITVNNAITETAVFQPTSTGVGDGEPLAFGLAQNAPNPVRGATTFAFTLPEQGEVRLDVLDLSGRRVAQAASGAFAAGRHELAWTARDGSGRALAAGVYYVRLAWNGREAAKRMVVTR